MKTKIIKIVLNRLKGYVLRKAMQSLVKNRVDNFANLTNSILI